MRLKITRDRVMTGDELIKYTLAGVSFYTFRVKTEKSREQISLQFFFIKNVPQR